MKKIFSLMIFSIMLLMVVACGDKTDTTNSETSTSTTSTSTTATETQTTESPYDLHGDEFIIMCDNKDRCDPRSPQYERLFKQEKIARIEEVEEKYNVKVVYETYPSKASWGGARERWIIEQTSLGKSPAHVYEITSYQIGTLATQEAISPLDDYIEAYGSSLYWPEKMAFGEINGLHYSYDDTFPLADEGIYYNLDLLERYLGAERRDEPTKLWIQGEWDWDAFRTITSELNDKLDENRAAENGGPQFVLGGRTYNWAYQMIGANGGHLVNPDLTVGLTSEETVAALNFLNELRSTPGMWLDNAPLNNASQPEFKDGNIAFHNGQSYWIFTDGKWKDRSFDIGFVPYPTGPNTLSDLSNYYINDVYGKISYVISSAYAKELVPPGYEDKMMHDEIIFKIWTDLQHFPELDSETGYGSITESADEFYLKRLLPYYGNEASREAHLSIISKAYPDYFYSMSEANNHNEEAYMIKIQQAVVNGDIRNKMMALEAEVKSTLIEKYKLGDDFYDNN